MAIERIKDWACFGGRQSVYRHASAATGTAMELAIYVPPHAPAAKLPVLIFLSGLSCNWENFTTKAGAQRYAAEHGIILAVTDTSPRGKNVPDDEAYDLGRGAGFYLDATQAPWATHFRMRSYVEQDLPDVLAEIAPVDLQRIGIMGHSMGGHGALTFVLREPSRYRSVSAIAPIIAPMQVPWGEKAFASYLGADEAIWRSYDATALAATTMWRKPILIDQGTADEFLLTQLKPELFAAACTKAGIPLELRMQDGYDHSYYCVATVIGDHIAWHARALRD